MARFGIGKTKVSLKVIQQGSVYESVPKETITLTREPNVASCLTTSIRRDEITVECGDYLMLTLDEGHNMFMGIVTKTVKSDIWCDVTAHDQLFWMAQMNKLYKTYENKKASEILIDLVQEKGLKMVDPPHVMDTKYVIPSLITEDKPLDIIQKALEQTQKNTGETFYLWDDCGNLCLHSEEWLATQPNLIISMGYIEDYTYTQTLVGMVTSAQVVSDKNNADGEEGKRQFYNAQDKDLISRYGELGGDDTLSENEDGNEKAQQILVTRKVLPSSLSVSGCQGDVLVRGGTPVYVDFFSRDNSEYIRGWFRTEHVTHTIDKGLHTMDLELKCIEMYSNWTDRGIGKSN